MCLILFARCFNTEVNRKPTTTDQYLLFDTHRPLELKLSHQSPKPSLLDHDALIVKIWTGNRDLWALPGLTQAASYH